MVVAVMGAVAAAVTTPMALAAAPPNDNRANAQTLGLAETVTGSTAEASVELVEPPSRCGPTGPSVWYRLDTSKSGRVIVLVHARGDLDVVVDVFLRERSRTPPVACDENDRRGQSSLDFNVTQGQSHLIRVAQQPQSGPGEFSLTIGLARPPEGPPGRALSSRGARGSVQRVFEPSNAWSARLREGRTYRVNLAGRTCLRLSIYPPRTRSFQEAAVRTRWCGGYTLLTPGASEGGRYSFRVEPGSSFRDVQRYRLQVRTGAHR